MGWRELVEFVNNNPGVPVVNSWGDWDRPAYMSGDDSVVEATFVRKTEEPPQDAVASIPYKEQP